MMGKARQEMTACIPEYTTAAELSDPMCRHAGRMRFLQGTLTKQTPLAGNVINDKEHRKRHPQTAQAGSEVQL